MVLIVSYLDGLYYSDVLSYSEIAKAIGSDGIFHPRVIQFPSCKHQRTDATARRVNATQVSLVWPQSDLNSNNEIFPGEMILTWGGQSDVLTQAPIGVTWQSDGMDGFWYPSFALVRGEDM